MTIWPSTHKLPTALYRLYDSYGTLLYVGVTIAPDKRFKEHAFEHNDWWPQVAREAITWHPNRFEAETAERDAIATECPQYNVMPGGITTISDYMIKMEARRVAKAKQHEEAMAAIAASKATGDHAVTPGSNETSRSVYVRHAGHQLAPHHHSGAWCSGRHYCEQCKAWSDGPVCPGKRLGLPHLASSLAASSATV